MNFFQRLLISFSLIYLSVGHIVKFRLHKKVPSFDDRLQYYEKAIELPLDKPNATVHDFKLVNFNNSQYVGEIYVGSNQQPLNVIFDTGSHFLVVPEKSLNQQFTNTFDCDLSETCLPSEDKEVFLKYGSGKVNGYVAEDQVTFGKNFPSTTLSFVIATEMSGLPREFHADGVFGLRKVNNLDNYLVWPTVDTIGETNYSLIENMKAQGNIEKRQFSFFLSNYDSEIKGEYGAEFTLGGYNPKYIKGSFSYLKVTSDNFWGVKMDGVDIGGTKISFPQKGVMAVFDSGTSLITLPKDIYASAIEVIKQKAGCEEIRRFMCLCANGPCGFDPEDFPSLVFEFEGFKAIIPGSVYVLNIEGYNVLEIIGLDLSERFIILGDPFMRQYVTLFDEDKEEIGVAKSIYFIEPTSYLQKRIVVLLMIPILVILLIGFCLWKNKKQREEDNIRLLNSSQGAGISMVEVKH